MAKKIYGLDEIVVQRIRKREIACPHPKAAVKKEVKHGYETGVKTCEVCRDEV